MLPIRPRTASAADRGPPCPPCWSVELPDHRLPPRRTGRGRGIDEGTDRGLGRCAGRPGRGRSAWLGRAAPSRLGRRNGLDWGSERATGASLVRGRARAASAAVRKLRLQAAGAERHRHQVEPGLGARTQRRLQCVIRWGRSGPGAIRGHARSTPLCAVGTCGCRRSRSLGGYHHAGRGADGPPTPMSVTVAGRGARRKVHA